MLTRRLIVCLTLNDGVLFRTKKFVPDYRYTLNFVDLDAADELVVLDITRGGPSEASRGVALSLAEKLFIPLSIGGWVRSVDDALFLLRNGADKVVVNTVAHEPGFIGALASRIGSQSIVVSIDVRDGYVWTDQGTKNTGLPYASFAASAAAGGAGEILLMDCERDGSLEGFNRAVLGDVAQAVETPIVAIGGCGAWRHCAEAYDLGADAATACIHHFTRNALLGAKRWLSERGYRMRP